MMHSPTGHTPEVTSFTITGGIDALEPDTALAIDAACAHLGLARQPATKPTSTGDTRRGEYRLHPIFAAFFEVTPRSKRRIELSPAELLGMIESPKKTIEAVLKRQNRTPHAEMPDQMRLFAAFYEGAGPS